MKKYFLAVLLAAISLSTQAQDSLFGSWNIHYFKTEKRELKCQDKFDAEQLALHKDGTYTRFYFLPATPDETPLMITYDMKDGKKHIVDKDGNPPQLIQVKKITEYGKYKVNASKGNVEFVNDKRNYKKQIRCKAPNLMIYDTLDNKLFIRVYRRQQG